MPSGTCKNSSSTLSRQNAIIFASDIFHKTKTSRGGSRIPKITQRQLLFENSSFHGGLSEGFLLGIRKTIISTLKRFFHNN